MCLNKVKAHFIKKIHTNLMYQCINSGLHNQGTPPGQNVIIREESYWFCYEYRVKKSGSLTNVAQDSMQISKIWWVVLTTSCTRQPVEIFISKTFAILTNIKKYLIVGIIIVISQLIRLTLILEKLMKMDDSLDILQFHKSALWNIISIFNLKFAQFTLPI